MKNLEKGFKTIVVTDIYIIPRGASAFRFDGEKVIDASSTKGVAVVFDPRSKIGTLPRKLHKTSGEILMEPESGMAIFNPTEVIEVEFTDKDFEARIGTYLTLVAVGKEPERPTVPPQYLFNAEFSVKYYNCFLSLIKTAQKNGYIRELKPEAKLIRRILLKWINHSNKGKVA